MLEVLNSTFNTPLVKKINHTQRKLYKWTHISMI